MRVSDRQKDFQNMLPPTHSIIASCCKERITFYPTLAFHFAINAFILWNYSLRDVFLSIQTDFEFMTHAEANLQDPKGQLFFLSLLNSVKNGTVCTGKMEQNLSPQQSTSFLSPTENKPDILTSLMRGHRELGKLCCIRSEYSLPR